MSADPQAGDIAFASFIDRILRLREEADALMADVKDVYAEAKANGYDKTAMGRLVAELRKRAKDASAVDQADAILDLYRDAYERASRGHTHTREAA